MSKSARYHERQAKKKSSWAEGNWTHGSKLRDEAKSHERKAESLRDEEEKSSSSSSGGGTPLSKEDKKKLKEKREKRHERLKRSALSKAVGNINVELEGKLPRTTEELEGFPDEAITNEEDGIYHFSEMLLRDEVERLIIEYRKSDRRKRSWSEEHKKEMKRQSYLGAGNHTYRSTQPIYDEDFSRLKNNPDRVEEIVSDYGQAIENNIEKALEEEYRRGVFENFDFTRIHGVGPSTAESLEEVKEKVEGATVRRKTLKVKELEPKFEHLLEFLKLPDVTGSHKEWETVEGVGPKTIERMEEIKEEIDEEVNEYVEAYSSS
jgi:hypothetical protein